MTPTSPTDVDVAGSSFGGAGTLRRELLSFRDRHPAEDIAILGAHTFLTPRWLAEREFRARRSAHRVALNNASFATPGGLRSVLLHNVTHFSSTAELKSIGFTPPRRMRAQIPVVRALARTADRIIVPTSHMAERVAHRYPGLAERIVVKMNPLSPIKAPRRLPGSTLRLLTPIVPQPYKNLEHHILELLSALDRTGIDAVVVSTADSSDFPALAGARDVEFIGRIDRTRFAEELRSSDGVFFPSTFESFGYPVAEARAAGRWVLAPDVEQYREIGGESLLGYTPGDADSLDEAVARLVEGSPVADAQPFDPDAYFNLVLNLS